VNRQAFDVKSFRKKLLFTALYFSEGAPIGFLWWALPTRLSTAGVPISEITGLSAILVLPWALKFLWAPAVDALRSERWTLRHWIVSSQLLMGLTLLPLFWLDLQADFELLKWILLAHACCAATQDVSIDALCISITRPEERGKYNGWMQAGMLAGRSLLGGGALILFSRFGNAFVVAALLAATLCSLILLFLIPEVRGLRLPQERTSAGESFRAMARSLRAAFSRRTMWLGVLFALTGGAAFEALGAIQGPLLRELGYSEEQVGWLIAVPYVILMACGSVAGGYLSDRFGHRRFVGCSLLLMAGGVATAGFLLHAPRPDPDALAVCVAACGFAIGLFVASSYAMFMDLTDPRLAGTQFSTFMGATNGCEAWSAKLAGSLLESPGRGPALWIMCGVSLLSLPLLWGLASERTQQTEC
jgi:MFS family permease